MQGWIKMHRQLLEWEWYKDINTKTVFIHLLLSANIKDIKYMGKTIKKGSLVIKTKCLADDLSLTENEVRTALKHLKQTGEIKTESTNKFTVVTVVNYSFFQDFEECSSQTNHNQNTFKSHSINKLLTSIEEEGKEEKENKNIDIVNDDVDEVSKNQKNDYAKYLEIYKQNIKSLPIPQVLSEKRKKALKSLTVKLSEADIAKVFKKAEESNFLSGRNGKWTGCNFDWLINYNNALKVLEGQYDNRTGQLPTTSHSSRFNNCEQRDIDPLKMRELEKQMLKKDLEKIGV